MTASSNEVGEIHTPRDIDSLCVAKLDAHSLPQNSLLTNIYSQYDLQSFDP